MHMPHIEAQIHNHIEKEPVKTPVERMIDRHFALYRIPGAAIAKETAMRIRPGLLVHTVRSRVEKMAREEAIPEDKLEAVEKAIEIGTDAHAGQKRKFSGDDYIVHPLRVAHIALDIAEALGYQDSGELVVEAILHDTIEDSDTTKESLIEAFQDHGSSFAQAIGEDVEALSHYENEDKVTLSPEAYADKIRTYPKSTVIDGKTRLRRLIVKTADRINNLMDPPIYPESTDLHPAKLRSSRADVIQRTNTNFIRLLLEDQPLLTELAETTSSISQASLDIPDFVPELWQQYLPKASGKV